MFFAPILTVTKSCHLETASQLGKRAFLAFNLKKVVVEFLFGDLEKRMTEAGMRCSLAEEAGR